MAARTQFKVNDKALKNVAALAGQLNVLDRTPVILAAMRKAAAPTVRRARALAPKPGYEGDQDEPPLNKNIIAVAKTYRRSSGDLVAWVGVGGTFPEGAHSHLVERGHELIQSRGEHAGAKIGEVEGTPFIEPAAKETATRFESIIADELIKQINKRISPFG